MPGEVVRALDMSSEVMSSNPTTSLVQDGEGGRFKVASSVAQGIPAQLVWFGGSRSAVRALNLARMVRVRS